MRKAGHRPRVHTASGVSVSSSTSIAVHTRPSEQNRKRHSSRKEKSKDSKSWPFALTSDDRRGAPPSCSDLSTTSSSVTTP